MSEPEGDGDGGFPRFVPAKGATVYDRSTDTIWRWEGAAWMQWVRADPATRRMFKAVNGPWPCPGHGEEVDMHDEHTKLCRECWRKRFRPRT